MRATGLETIFVAAQRATNLGRHFRPVFGNPVDNAQRSPIVKFDLTAVRGARTGYQDVFDRPQRQSTTQRPRMPTIPNRIAVIGLYRSGSTLAAGLLHRLGVDMGAPFWGDYYEPADLSEQLRRWWDEPLLEPTVNAEHRVAALREWVERREVSPHAFVGAKHPLLSLSGPELVEAWGTETRFIWTYRPLKDSVDSIARLGWWPERREGAQEKLWEATHEFFENREHLRISFDDMLDSPNEQIAKLVEFTGLSPTDRQMREAVAFVRPRRKKGDVDGLKQATERRAVEPVAAKATEGERETPQPVSDKIVATILSGNSADIVADAVSSAIDWVDEVLLIDTGISDGTADLVERLSGSKFRRSEFSWRNDFAAARNWALQEATRLGAGWALTLDTDERISVDGLRDIEEFRDRLRSEPQILTWSVTAAGGSYAKERIIRVPTTLVWRGRTHEALTGASPDQRKLLAEMRFNETPKIAESSSHKLERDLVILMEETRDKPDNPRWWYYLGQTLDGLKRKREAADAYLHCAALDGWSEEAAWAHYQAAKCMADLKEFREAIRSCAAGLVHQPGTPELAWFAGFCCYQLGQYRNAVHWERIAIAQGNVEGTGLNIPRTGFRHLPGMYEGPYDVLRFAYRKLGMERAAQTAEQQHERARSKRIEDNGG